MAHAPLLRTNTAPVFPQSADGVPRLNTMSMGGAPRASQLSGSTAFASTTSLTSLSSSATLVSPPTNGQVVATSNIINQKADASRSLYQICVSLKQRLGMVPDFEPYMDQLTQLEVANGEGPVEAMWQLLRTGHPLLTIYNTLQPPVALVVDDAKANDAKKAKIAIFKFIKACLGDLGIASSESFVINDLTGTDTTGFVKVMNVVNYVLDIAQQRGLLQESSLPYPEDDAPPATGAAPSYRDYIIREMVDTERKYVQDLENLHDLKKALDQRGNVPGDTLHQIFMNINAILDFQRRFLIRVETTNSMPQAAQQWGSPFVNFEESFDIYQPFIANQRKAAMTAQSVFDKIKAVDHPVAVDFNTLDGFLLKPMQRLVKYPLLLKDLMKKSEDESIKNDLAMGIAAASRVLQKANQAVDRDLLDEALDDLVTRVDDWKNHKVEQFGKLLLHGVYTVVTGKSEQEKDYEIYLFECILLCCKEVTPNKSKDKKDKTKSTGPRIRNRNARLQLKGRIFMTNVTEVLSFAKPGSYTVQIWWKGDPGVENFVIRFQNEDTMKKWATGLDTQRKENAPQPSQSPADQSLMGFVWTQGQAPMENPYAQQEEEDEDELPMPTATNSQYGAPTGTNSQYGAPTGTNSQYGAPNSQYGAPMSQYSAPVSQYGMPPGMGTMPRTPSNSSLRARPATGESVQSMGGLAWAPPRYPLPQPPGLSIQTQMVGPPSQSMPSPNGGGPRGGDSYFSPVAESPVSSRTSTTSGIFPPSAGYPFPKNGTPQPGGWEGDSNRFTAPAMPRAPSRDGPSPANAYGMVVPNGRNPRGPSLPVMSQNPQTLAQQQRSRSYSTPDINGQPARRAPGGSQGNIPAVPGIPPHLHPAHEQYNQTIPRSNTGSPGIPLRSATQSPSAQRERLQQQNIPYGGTMSQFPTHPVYPRQSTSGPGPTSAPQGMVPAPLNLGGADPSTTVSTPPLGAGTSAPGANAIMSPDLPIPTQLKVKVNYDTSNYMTLVVAYNITYQSLIDRIDAKLARFTNSAIAKGNLKLRYRDEDGDFVSIESDDDIHIAFSEWRDGMRNMYNAGVGEIELFCVGETG